MKKLFSFLMVLGTMMVLGWNAQAQCAAVGIDANGEAVSIALDCSFPVLQNTGNAEADEAAYLAEKNAWKDAYPDQYEAFVGLGGFSYYEIHQADLDAMAAGKKAAIEANPGLYHIIQ